MAHYLHSITVSIWTKFGKQVVESQEVGHFEKKTKDLPRGIGTQCLLSWGEVQSILRFCRFTVAKRIHFVTDVTGQRRADNEARENSRVQAFWGWRVAADLP